MSKDALDLSLFSISISRAALFSSFESFVKIPFPLLCNTSVEGGVLKNLTLPQQTQSQPL